MLGGTQFEDAQRILRSEQQARKAGGSGELIIQEWLDGQQVSTESVIVEGKALFTAVAVRNYARLEEFAPYVIEDGSDTETGDRAQGSEISRLVEAACAVLGWDNLTVKGDLVCHEGEWVIIELAARLSGGYFASAIIPAVYGVDVVGAAAALAVERSFVLDGQKYSVACQRYIFPDPADLGKRVVEVKAPKLNGEIVSATLHLKPGDQIGRAHV